MAEGEGLRHWRALEGDGSPGATPPLRPWCITLNRQPVAQCADATTARGQFALLVRAIGRALTADANGGVRTIALLSPTGHAVQIAHVPHWSTSNGAS